MHVASFATLGLDIIRELALLRGVGVLIIKMELNRTP